MCSRMMALQMAAVLGAGIDKEPFNCNEADSICTPWVYGTTDTAAGATCDPAAPLGCGMLDGWGAYSLCGVGKEQSPINIPAVETLEQSDSPLKLTTGKCNSMVELGGHDIEVQPEGTACLAVDYEGVRYNALQCHFHMPSENVINGRRYPLESHCVTLADDGSILAIGTMFDTSPDAAGSAASLSFQRMLDAASQVTLPATNGENLTDFEVSDFVAPDVMDRHFAFRGSLTTPGCQEGLQWIVAANPLMITEEQAQRHNEIFQNQPEQFVNSARISNAAVKAAFQTEGFVGMESLMALQPRVFSQNARNSARPVQPLNQRTVKAFGMHSDITGAKSTTTPTNGDSNGAPTATSTVAPARARPETSTDAPTEAPTDDPTSGALGIAASMAMAALIL